jgi:hypothetical protein
MASVRSAAWQAIPTEAPANASQFKIPDKK